MFTSLKIEADKWPWARLSIPEQISAQERLDRQETVPTIYPQNGISSGHDVRYTFKDTYRDLRDDVEKGTRLSEDCDGIPPDYLA